MCCCNARADGDKSSSRKACRFEYKARAATRGSLFMRNLIQNRLYPSSTRYVYIRIYTWRTPLSFRARGWGYKKLGAGEGQGRTTEERPLWFIIPRKFCFSSVHANCVRVHPSFSLSRLTEQPSPRPVPRSLSSDRLSLRSSSLFRAISQSDWLPPLLSACQHFYTFIRSSPGSLLFPRRIRTVTIRSWRTSTCGSLSRCRRFSCHLAVYCSLERPRYSMRRIDRKWIGE